MSVSRLKYSKGALPSDDVLASIAVADPHRESVTGSGIIVESAMAIFIVCKSVCESRLTP